MPDPFSRKAWLIAEALGRKHRNYGNSIELNPFTPSTPQHDAYREGWTARDLYLRSKRPPSTPETRAEALGRKHRSAGNSIELNYFEPGDPCHEAYNRGWRRRDAELNPDPYGAKRERHQAHVAQRKLVYAAALGRKHRRNKVSRDANPYPKSDPCHDAYLTGWLGRMADVRDKPRVKYDPWPNPKGK